MAALRALEGGVSSQAGSVRVGELGEFRCPGCRYRLNVNVDDATVYVNFGGIRFFSPFLCICCGREVCAHQFAFARLCANCDVGQCRKNSNAEMYLEANSFPLVRHSDPPWGDGNNYNGRWERYLEHVRHIALDDEFKIAVMEASIREESC